ncbi:M24 family metallopeptidase [Streptomyces sp. NBC_01803]|uniref:M24 family metallopeptidase n=1 Tax=Streptomyces sp. NBC_01803 TaxID=2975946 RepID=UPI002DD85DC2|nr:M24 family metallopeptidase [Streptomyces sp. NBC_01803]WSA47172.1 aminopeptidase P family protein [Streptomyces sp. NBC_01803]
MSEVHAARRSRLRSRCSPAGSVAALVSRPANVRYLAGSAPSGGSGPCEVPPGAALLVSHAGDDVLFGHWNPARDPAGPQPGEDGGLRAVTLDGDADPAVAAAEWAARDGAEILAVEEHHLTVARHRDVAAAASGMKLADLGCAVEGQRLVKDEEEIAALRVAAEITDRALGELLESILVGRTERHLALELERRLVDHGADGPAFSTSVATGSHSGLAGHRPTDRRVEEGDFLTVRLGARFRGYRCQIGRTFVIGTSPADWQIELYEVVFAAQRAAREALTPGAEYREVDRAARNVLAAAGHSTALGPVTGRGVGLEIGEDPRLSPAAMGRLGPCVPVTVEPGVHLPGRGGVRIDDTLVVRSPADGGPELLTITTKELLAL